MIPERVESSPAGGLSTDWYVEYSRESTRLARLLKSTYQRGLGHHISRLGLQFRTSEGLEEGVTLYLKLHMPGAACPVRAKAQVRWVREEPWSGIEDYTHVIGAAFVDCPSETWAVLEGLGR